MWCSDTVWCVFRQLTDRDFLLCSEIIPGFCNQPILRNSRRGQKCRCTAPVAQRCRGAGSAEVQAENVQPFSNLTAGLDLFGLGVRGFAAHFLWSSPRSHHYYDIVLTYSTTYSALALWSGPDLHYDIVHMSYTISCDCLVWFLHLFVHELAPSKKWMTNFCQVDMSNNMNAQNWRQNQSFIFWSPG
jgi:hypothetical protein